METNEVWLREIVIEAPHAVMLVRLSAAAGIVPMFCNRQALVLLGAADFTNELDLCACWPELFLSSKDQLERVGRTGRPFRNQITRIGTRPGAVASVHAVTAYRVGSAQLAIVCNDVTAEESEIARLREVERRFHLLAEATIEGVAICEGGQIVLANHALGRLLGCHRQDLHGRTGMDLFTRDARYSDETIAANKTRAFRATVKRTDGTSFPVRVRIKRLLRSEGLFEVVAISDLSEHDALRSVTKRLKKSETLALNDGLTNLYNRRYFDETLRREFARSRRLRTPLSLIAIDLDHFKAVNDTHGHAAGDKVLIHVAGLLASNRRETDTLARIGGEEFALILPDTPQDAAVSLGERLRQSVASSCPALGRLARRTKITASFGIATGRIDIDGGSLRALLADADAALYQAKAAGRNRVVLSSAVGTDGKGKEVS